MPKFREFDRVRVSSNNEETRFFYNREGTVTQVWDDHDGVGYTVEIENDPNSEYNGPAWFAEHELESVNVS